MADFGINPNIAMGFQGNPANKPMTLNELVGLSRNVMEDQKNGNRNRFSSIWVR